ncbi:uncharacterized protein LOC143464573 [Clavelina lepadiformis]|uniref:uncharacterized protein LOC143464573 n=1 Tax=Clavelina lepadiformis TaxID=159417 RepID=UPI004042C6AE
MDANCTEFFSALDSSKVQYKWTKNEFNQNIPSNAIGRLSLKTAGYPVRAYLSTPRVTLSPVVTTCQEISCLIIITVPEFSSIEIWRFVVLRSGQYKVEPVGCLRVAGLTSWSQITCDNSGSDINKVADNVTYFRLYITCPQLGVIKYIFLPTFNFVEQNMRQTCKTITHDSLYKPVAIASSKVESSKVAVCDGSSGFIFIFQQSQTNSDFQVTKVISNRTTLSSTSFISFDDSDNIWASNFENNLLLHYDGRNNRREEFTAHRLGGIYHQAVNNKSFLIGCDMKHNRVVVQRSNSLGHPSETLLRPCNIHHPLAVSGSKYINMIVVTSRCFATKTPLVQFYSFKDLCW